MSVVLMEKRDKVAYITLNRADKLNSINAEVRDGLYGAFQEVRDDPNIWIAVITGAGRAFSTGHDLIEMGAEAGAGRSTEDLYQFIMETYKPTISAINGYCLAQGGGIALSCDIRIASDKAQFGWPQVKRGISSTSGPVILCQRIPLNVALNFLFTGEFVDAQEALRLHLVNMVVPHEKLMEETENYVRKIIKNAPLAMRGIKEVAIRGFNLKFEDRVRFAGLIGTKVRGSRDAQEGLDAFKEKRAPVYQGR